MNKYKAAIKKEFFIYLITLLVLMIIAHSDILSDPLNRLDLMSQKENYSHPFLYSFIIYSILFILRKTIDFIAGLFDKKDNS